MRSRWPRTNPITAWKSLRDGNARFTGGQLQHPGQSAADRAKLVAGQQPKAILFGCGDSRVAAEITFDQGLGDMFAGMTTVLWPDHRASYAAAYGSIVLVLISFPIACYWGYLAAKVLFSPQRKSVR